MNDELRDDEIEETPAADGALLDDGDGDDLEEEDEDELDGFKVDDEEAESEAL